MKSIVIAVLPFLIAGVISHPAQVINPVDPDIKVGEPCSPKHPKDCGEAELLLESSAPAGNGYGPNVCEIEMLYSVPTYSYEYINSCRKRKCSISCASTGLCDSARNTTKTKFSCCEGFTTANSSECYAKRNGPQGKPKKHVLKQDGCPREILPTVLDCLNQLNLSSLAKVFMDVGFDILALNDAEITLFAPRIELGRSYFGDREPGAVLGTHIINKTIFAACLDNGKKLETLSDGLFLHVSQVNMKGANKILFINGMELTEHDACVASNGIVHVIDHLILAEQRTVAEVVADTEELSVLNSLIAAADIDKLKLNGSKLLTFFAPTNEAFKEFESLGFVDCLLMEQNGNILQRFLEGHISKSAEYSQSLVLQKHVQVVSNGRRYPSNHHANHKHYQHHPNKKNKFLEVQYVNNTILLGEDKVEVTQADIAASNGVIHFISAPLSISMLDLDELCSAATAPTTIPPTTTSVRTEVPPTNSSVRTEVPPTTISVRTEVPPTTTSVRTEVPPTTTSVRTEIPPTTSSVHTEDSTITTTVPEGGRRSHN